MLKWFSLYRWENYCLLALASVTLMLCVAIRTQLQRHPHRRALAAALDLGTTQTVVPRPRDREPQWLRRHAHIVAATQTHHDVMLLGDSITQGWEFNATTWKATFPGVSTLNAGIASDRVEHVLWRVEHGLFATDHPRVVVLLAGINNVANTEPLAIADGIGQVIRAVHARSPGTKVLVLGLFPAGARAENPKRARIVKVNYAVAAQARADHADFLDIGDRFLETDGSLKKTTSFDYLHLTRKGYAIWAHALAPELHALLQR